MTEPSAMNNYASNLVPSITVSERALHLGDLIKEYSLPRVIKIDKRTCPARDRMTSQLDLMQPLMAFTKWSVRKVAAQNLVYSSAKADFIPVGSDILIPENYPGWFAVRGAPADVTKLQTVVPHFTKLSSLAISRCSHFLLGGRRLLNGVMIQRGEAGETNTIPCQILPGTVLRKAGLFQAEQPLPKGGKKKKGQDLPHREFLKCFDDQEREMYLNSQQTGTFYIVAQKGTPISPPVLQMGQILQRFRFPLVVQLIFGRAPATSCGFTEILLLTESGNSQTLVASTLFSSPNINLEIPVGTNMRFHVAENMSSLLKHQLFVSVVRRCKEQIPGYLRDMKVVVGDSQLEHDKYEQESATDTSSPNSKTDSHNIPQNIEDNTADTSLDAKPDMRTPKRHKSIISRISYLSDIPNDNADLSEELLTTSVVVGNSPGNKKSDAENTDVGLSGKFAEVRKYEIPGKETLVIKGGALKHSIDEHNSGEGSWEYRREDTWRHVYCTASLPREDHPDEGESSPNNETAKSGSVNDSSLIYSKVWEEPQQTFTTTNYDPHANSGVPQVPVETTLQHVPSHVTGNSNPTATTHPHIRATTPPHIKATTRPLLTASIPQVPTSVTTRSSPNIPTRTSPNLPSKISPNLSSKISQNLPSKISQNLPTKTSPNLPIKTPPKVPSKPFRLKTPTNKGNGPLAEETLIVPPVDEQHVTGAEQKIDNLMKIFEPGSCSQLADGRSYNKKLRIEDTGNLDVQRSKNDGHMVQQVINIPDSSHKKSNSHICRETELSASSLTNNLSIKQYQGIKIVTNREIGGYITPIDFEYPRLQTVEDGTCLENTYSETESLRTDSGVFDEFPLNVSANEYDFLDFDNFSEESLDAMQILPGKLTKTTNRLFSEPPNIGWRPDRPSMPPLLNARSFQDKMPGDQSTANERANGPPLPRRTKPRPITPRPRGLGEVILKSCLRPQGPHFTQANKDMLIEQLVAAGITETTELALRSLQMADFIALMAKQDDFDDELIALLPKVGALDLRRIAMCFNGMKINE